ncbi:MAG: hypothetical protein A4E53_02946 [Pelotomaculum sp. PtaB.Bin104]|nr:MAG: hypothetical protein A4E53_02946 [Pelotomaculum sp. PtaB.Bin104]
MNETKVMINQSPQVDDLHLGDLLSLWDVARNKTIGLSILALFYRQASDPELKFLLKTGTEAVVYKHINNIQKLLKGKGFDFPAEQNWLKKFDEDSSFHIPRSIIDDEEIAISLREIVRLTLTLETEALRNSSQPAVRKLMTRVLADDNEIYDKIIQLQIKHSWSDYPPLLLPEQRVSG